MSDEKESLSHSAPSSPPPSNSLPNEAPPAYEAITSLLGNHTNGIRLPDDNPSILSSNTLHALHNPFGFRPPSRTNSIRLPDDTPSTTSSNNHHTQNTPPSFRTPNAPNKSHSRSQSSSSVSSLKGKKSWFSFASSTSTAPPTSRKPNDGVRSTVQNLVRDLVQEHSSGSPAALGILQSCAEACTAHSISLSDILQDKFIESHSALYWAIVKRRVPDPHDDIVSPDEPDLLDALLKQASPLNAETATELRHACLATSDHFMFQRLRILPQFTETSGADKVILGASLPPDDVTVELGPGNEGAFAVNFQLYQFHKRMMVSKEIKQEFVARNRIWKATFMITPDNAWYGPPPGSWSVALALQEASPPTWFDGRIVLPESDKPLRLRSKQLMEGPKNDVPATQIVVGMDDSPDFASLQYSGSTFIPADEKLRVRLEAKLRKPDFTSDTCVISRRCPGDAVAFCTTLEARPLCQDIAKKHRKFEDDILRVVKFPRSKKSPEDSVITVVPEHLRPELVQE